PGALEQLATVLTITCGVSQVELDAGIQGQAPLLTVQTEPTSERFSRPLPLPRARIKEAEAVIGSATARGKTKTLLVHALLPSALTALLTALPPHPSPLRIPWLPAPRGGRVTLSIHRRDPGHHLGSCGYSLDGHGEQLQPDEPPPPARGYPGCPGAGRAVRSAPRAAAEDDPPPPRPSLARALQLLRRLPQA